MLQKSSTYCILAVLLLFLGKEQVYAQTGNNWIFRYYVGLSFNTEPPTAFKNAAVGSSNAAISDSLGKLLVYADESNTYNRYHQPIENGKFLISGAGDFCAQQAILLALHESNNLYLHFFLRMDANTHKNVRLYYNKIDVAANAGNGKVISKENLVYNAYGPNISGITAVRKADGFWLLFRGLDTIYAFPLTSAGIGKVVKSAFPGTNDNFVDIMSFKASSKGDALVECIVNYSDYYTDSNTIITNWLNLYSFDNETGKVYNKRTIEKISTKRGSSNAPPYTAMYRDAVFSPNDSFIYVANNDLNFTGIKKENPKLRGIWQYQRYAADPQKTKIEISRNISKAFSMQLAPNGKIYIIDSARRNWLSAINYPDRRGAACNYQPAVIQMYKHTGPGEEGFIVGFVFPNVLFEYMRVRFSYKDNLCKKASVLINESDTNVFKSFRWYFCDKNGKIFDSLDAFSPNYNFPYSGKFFVKLRGTTPKGYFAWYSDSVTYIKSPTAKFTYKDTLGCQWVGMQFTNQSFADTFKYINSEAYLWDFGDGTTDTAKDPLHIFTKSGKFDVRLIYSNGFCTDTFSQQQSIEILAAPKPGFAVSDTIGCAPFRLEIKDQSAGEVEKYTYTFGDGFQSADANPSYTFTKPGIYWVSQKLLGKTGCITSDSINIRIREGILPGEKPEMLRATFNEKNEIEISWKKHPLAEYYSLYKQRDKNTFAPLQKHFLDTAYIDSDVSLDKTTSYYITATDSCGNTSSPSFVAQPVILQAENINNQYILLQATTYSKWQNGVQEYVLEMKDNSNNFLTVNNNFKDKYDDSMRFFTSPLQQCYRIKAVEAGGNKQISYSNQICARHLPQLYIPSAFSPNNDELNDRFAIYTTGIRTYKIDIYNRWGELVFSGDESSNFWDGKFKSTFCPVGEYLYTIHARSSIGDHISRTGNVMLMR